MLIEANASESRKWPGDPPFWAFIFGDLLVFGIIFIAMVYAGTLSPKVFNQGHAQLNQSFGLVNTLVLLTSSWFVANGVNYHRQSCTKQATRFLAIGIMLSIVFCAIKVLEYSEKFESGLGPNSSEFFMYYFIVTGIHLLHVVIATVVLVVTTLVYRNKLVDESTGYTGLETAALFWHLVDLLWVFLFAIIYLVRYPQ